jgi:hypothetical protein
VDREEAMGTRAYIRTGELPTDLRRLEFASRLNLQVVRVVRPVPTN